MGIVIIPLTQTASSTSTTKVVEATNSPSAKVSKLFNNSGYGTLLLTSNYQYRTFNTQDNYVWGLNLSGGTPPYVVTVSWDDGTDSNLYFKTDPAFSVQYSYDKSGTYNIIISCIDSLGEQVIMQLSSNIRDSQNSTLGITSLSGGNSAVNSVANSLGLLKSAHRLLYVIWPSYLIIILMAFSFWLGEKRELQAVTVRSRSQKR